MAPCLPHIMPDVALMTSRKKLADHRLVNRILDMRITFTIVLLVFITV